MNIQIRVANASASNTDLTAVLFRSPGAHSEAYETVENLTALKEANLSAKGIAKFSHSEDEISELRVGKRKVIYLVLSIYHKKRPIFISRA